MYFNKTASVKNKIWSYPLISAIIIYDIILPVYNPTLLSFTDFIKSLIGIDSIKISASLPWTNFTAVNVAKYLFVSFIIFILKGRFYNFWLIFLYYFHHLLI
jgi:hypothetical protein